MNFVERCCRPSSPLRHIDSTPVHVVRLADCHAAQPDLIPPHSIDPKTRSDDVMRPVGRMPDHMGGPIKMQETKQNTEEEKETGSREEERSVDMEVQSVCRRQCWFPVGVMPHT